MNDLHTLNLNLINIIEDSCFFSAWQVFAIKKQQKHQKKRKYPSLKGVFAKNEREYRLTSKNNCIWSLPILLLSVASIKRKLLKMTYAEERSVHTNLESCNIGLMLQLSEFKWTPRSSVLVVFNNVLLLDVTDRSKISSDQKPILPYHFSQTLPLNWNKGLEVINTDKYLPSCFTWWKSFYYLVKVLLLPGESPSFSW